MYLVFLFDYIQVPLGTIVRNSEGQMLTFEVYSIQHDKVCQWVEAGLWIFPVTPVSSTNKTEILLKVALCTPLNVFSH
jgi:hypothetical protein